MIKLFISEDYLQEALNDIKKYYPNIDDEMFMTLINLDPTYRGNDSAGKYGKWLLNLYNKGNLSEEEFEEVTPLLNQFTTYRNRVQNKDLNSYKSLDALSDVLASVIDDDSMLTDRQKLRFLKNVKSGKIKTNAENDYETVYNDSDWIVCVPHTHEASMKLGKGTEWCTAHENPEWYETYTYEDGEEFSLYIMKNKHTGERFQYCDNYYRGTAYQAYPFMDESDTEVDEFEFMVNCDDVDFKNFLNGLNPEFFKNIRYANDLIIEDDTVVGTADYFEPDVIIPDDVMYIGEQAFYKSDSINSVYISCGVEQIEFSAFSRSTLKKIDLDDAHNLSYIGFNAFKYCEDLQTIINLPNVEFIGDGAFASSEITQVYIGDTIAVIGKEAFFNCGNLTNIEIEGCAEPLKINSRTFTNCFNLKTLRLPKNIASIADNAFGNEDIDLIIYSDSQWLRDNIEQFNINLYSSDEEPIYIKDKGFVD
jgi:hypothetical protein